MHVGGVQRTTHRATDALPTQEGKQGVKRGVKRGVKGTTRLHRLVTTVAPAMPLWKGGLRWREGAGTTTQGGGIAAQAAPILVVVVIVVVIRGGRCTRPSRSGDGSGNSNGCNGVIPVCGNGDTDCNGYNEIHPPPTPPSIACQKVKGNPSLTAAVRVTGYSDQLH